MTLDFKDLARQIAEVAADKKGQDIISLDLKNISLVADYFVIISGGSVRQVKAIVEAIKDGIGRSGVNPERIEGEREGLWVLLDYGGVVVHVFHKEAREYYQLEMLWADAPRLELETGTQTS